MLDPAARELRKIRHILTAILVCLVLIVLLMIPGLFGLALICLIVYGLLMFLLSVSQAFRTLAYNVWFDITAFFGGRDRRRQ